MSKPFMIAEFRLCIERVVYHLRAKAIGFEIPVKVLALADEVIE
jgi:hypothetical protein